MRRYRMIPSARTVGLRMQRRAWDTYPPAVQQEARQARAAERAGGRLPPMSSDAVWHAYSVLTGDTTEFEPTMLQSDFIVRG